MFPVFQRHSGCPAGVPTWTHVDRQYGESCFGMVCERVEGMGSYLPITYAIDLSSPHKEKTSALFHLVSLAVDQEARSHTPQCGFLSKCRSGLRSQKLGACGSWA